MKYRIAKSSDSSILAEIHNQAFKDFFLTQLGLSFLNVYYKAVIQYNESISVCAVDEDNKIIGFATGCQHSKGFNLRLVMKNIFPFLIQAVRLVFTRLSALYRIIKNFEKKENPDDDGNYAELHSIAVLPEAKGSGIGKGLLLKFEQEARLKGCQKIALTTDYYNNDQVIDFYKRNGYQIYYDFHTFPNRRMHKMIKDFNL